MKNTHTTAFKMKMVTAILWVSMAFISCDKEGYGPYPSPGVSKVQFAGSQLEIAENQQEKMVEILINPRAKSNGFITLNITNNQASYGEDFRTVPAATNGKIIIPVDAGADKAFFMFLPRNNTGPDPLRSVTFAMVEQENSTLKPEGKTSILVKLIDDENLANIGFEVDRASVTENNANGYLVKLPVTPALAEEGFVEIAYSTIQAQYEKDFRIIPAPADGKLRIPVAAQSTFASFVVIPVNDQAISSNRSIQFSIVGASPHLQPSGKTAFTLSITDQENQKPEMIQSIRSSFNGDLVYFVIPVWVEGVVVSSTDNTGPNMLFLLDETGAIAFLFNGRHHLQPGERIRVNLEGGVLEELNQALTITNIPVEQVERKGSEIVVLPEMTLGQLYERPGELEGQIVTVTGVQFPAANGSTTLEGVHFIQGNNREARVLVNSFASFKNQIIPGGTVSVKGILVWNDAGYYTILPQRAGDVK